MKKIGMLDIYMYILHSRLVKKILEFIVKYDLLSYIPFYYKSVLSMFIYNIFFVVLFWYLIFKLIILIVGLF